ncbi:MULTISPECIES: alpha/beta hydrolase [Legionella]|uniref:Putative hydrolase n=1 Tax=Legionella maceachernii TaxID=466 RepID=A0A0W0W3T3_9GAMM|nr:alpha/beta fold hydrolase [Legionella maceachernii]KTD27124.1 putative hydrolase [Legionella maceachernii]SKA14343.1 Esterase/lipase [Legionella maceachernii]SUP04899.1 acetoin dehydrogenase E2 subunit dihydrolipoyllysine-residue acetyltransferase [Legionella maceachernii]
MRTKILTEFWDLIHAQLCYQLFITPLHLPIEKEYRHFARKACEFFVATRSHSISIDTPRHHVIHCFEQVDNPQAKKVLIAHGWISRAAYMARLIRALHRQGYHVYAIDFPAHGEAKGVQLTWTDAVMILQQTINKLGPFYAVIGHSFGGSMLLNTLNLACQFPEWKLDQEPERMVLMSSPTRMRTPVSQLARRLKLSGKGFIFLRELFRQHATTDLKHLDFRHFIKQSKTPVLCIHGEKDDSISPYESIIFCAQYPHASLALLPEANHVSVLIDERVESKVCDFLA